MKIDRCHGNHKDNQSVRRYRQLTFTVTMLVLALAVGACNKVDGPKSGSSASKQITSTSVSDSHSRSASKDATTQSANKNDDATQTKNSTSIITDYQKYDYLSGNYINSTRSALPDILNFKNGTFTTHNALGSAYTNHFDQVIRHPDGSLVINVTGQFDYPDPQDHSQKKTMIVHFSLLLAPAGTQIQKNWQTSEPMTDTTDSQHARFAIATSDDDGKTFNMAPAYAGFAVNNSTGLSVKR